MNSGGASAGGLNGAPRVVEREEAARERDGEAAAQLWMALAQQVSSAQALPQAESETPSAWHPSGGVLTPGCTGTESAGGAPVDLKAPERLVLRVDGGALGELEVTLDRQDGALRVVIGMENQHLVSSVLPDARALRSALESAGITVQSLNVVQASEVGTVLAQRRLTPSGPKPGNRQSAEQDSEEERKRKHKRLTLIG
ncbi:MAG TPA: flagellar hook-length control protein FliK [Polyangiaceae bacterium]|nr:flagellar hook-length control protein FliK [Polyangiaceae bacterium]